MNHALVLALETSTEFCSVALATLPSRDENALQGGREPHALFVRHENTGVASSERLLPAVREVFGEARCDLSDCAVIAFGAGPGAFTGVRTATGVAQGLAFALQIPVVPINTLSACAQAARRRNPSATRVLAALDARMDEVYWGVFEWEEAQADWRVTQTATVTAPEQVSTSGIFTLAGNAATIFGPRLAAQADAASVDAQALPHAASIAWLGWRGWRAGRAMPASEALPEYVRNRVALKTAERAAKI